MAKGIEGDCGGKRGGGGFFPPCPGAGSDLFFLALRAYFSCYGSS